MFLQSYGKIVQVYPQFLFHNFVEITIMFGNHSVWFHSRLGRPRTSTRWVKRHNGTEQGRLHENVQRGIEPSPGIHDGKIENQRGHDDGYETREVDEINEIKALIMVW